MQKSKSNSFPAFILLLTLIILSAGCVQKNKKEKLIIFHAGSLSVPFKKIAKEFELKYPNINVQLESAGSRTCARKISDLNKPCDIMASADYKVINNLLIPEYADWNLKFASNEMVIVYSENSKYSKQITPNNWYNILLKSDVNYGRSEPNADPCGYRTVLSNKLNELKLNKPGIADSILQKDNQHIRPKEVDLLALLESGTIDYAFIYRSVAKQHNLPFISLSDSINLKNPELTPFYNKVSVEISGKKPGETISHRGEPMIYSLTQIKNAPNAKNAELFLNFFFTDSMGVNIMTKCGQPSAIPKASKTYNQIPDYLKKFALPSSIL